MSSQQEQGQKGLPAEGVQELRARLFSAFAEACLQVPEPESVWATLRELYTQPHRYYHTLQHLAHMLDALDALYEGQEGRPLPAWSVLATFFHDAIYDPQMIDNEEASAQLAWRLLQGKHQGQEQSHEKRQGQEGDQGRGQEGCQVQGQSGATQDALAQAHSAGAAGARSQHTAQVTAGTGEGSETAANSEGTGEGASVEPSQSQTPSPQPTPSLRLLQQVEQLILSTKHHQPVSAPGQTFDQGFDQDLAAFLDADLAVLGSEQGHYLGSYAASIRKEYAHVPRQGYLEGRSKVLRGLLDRPHLYYTAWARERLESRARANMQAELQLLAAGVIPGKDGEG